MFIFLDKIYISLFINFICYINFVATRPHKTLALNIHRV